MRTSVKKADKAGLIYLIVMGYNYLAFVGMEVILLFVVFWVKPLLLWGLFLLLKSVILDIYAPCRARI